MSIAVTLPESLEPFGQGLHRPECVLGTPAGDVFVPDWREARALHAKHRARTSQEIIALLEQCRLGSF